jgi:hypothetical protein
LAVAGLIFPDDDGNLAAEIQKNSPMAQMQKSNNPADAKVESHQTTEAPKLLFPSSQQQLYNKVRNILLMTTPSPGKA